MGPPATFTRLVKSVGQIYAEQRMACSVTERARELVEELTLNAEAIPHHERAAFDHILSEMHAALLAPTEALRIDALGYALGEFLEWLFHIAPTCRCSKCASRTS